MGSQKQHVVLFPFMAQGHITPFLLLAELIHRKNPSFTITLVNTPQNIQQIQSSLPPHSTIQLKSLPFSGSNHGLPPNAETAAAIPFHLFVNLFQASETLHPAFDHLIADITQQDGRPPLCIIADPFFGWTVDVAKKFGVFHSIFSTSGAFGSAVYLSFWWHLPHNLTTADDFVLPDFPEIRIKKSQLAKHMLAADGKDPWSIFLRRQISHNFRSDSMLINTVEEFEKTGLTMLRKFVRVPVWSVGPIFRQPTSNSGESSCVKWLDSHANSSVLYVSFGSQNTISASQMVELASGLEASGRPFIWVVRPPVGFDIKGEFRAEWLPVGFEDRNKQGMVVRGWAPQVEILSHPSTGAFMSHCGWNSVLESLVNGVPIIGWPLSGDQLYNSKSLESEVGVCVEVATGNTEYSKVGREGVERVIGVVMGDDERGQEIRRKARKVREVLRAAMETDGGGGGGGVGDCSVSALDEFFRVALSKRKV